jgi:aspartyl-tRNA(Asn)/glutamyl-tRNA(Gln) amidotransferase subunit C
MIIPSNKSGTVVYYLARKQDISKVRGKHMPEAITPEIFQKLVRLASLDVGEAEGEYLRQQLNNQLSSVAELEAIPLDEDIQVTSHGVAYSPEITPEMRADEHTPYKKPEKIVGNAPESEDGYFVVPNIPIEGLDK